MNIFSRAGIPLLFFLFIIVFSASLKAKIPDVESFHEKSFLALYNFRFDKADSLIGHMHLHYPQHFLTYLSKANFFWWKMISQKHDPLVLKEYYKSLEKAEDLLISGYQRDNNRAFIDYHLANIYALRVRIELMNGNYLKSFNYLRKYSHLIPSLLEEDDQIPGALVAMGVYNYLSDYGKKRYPVFSLYAYMFPPGDMQKGIEQLKNASKMKNKLVLTDANYFLMKIFFELDHNLPEAYIHASRLLEMYPNNLIFLYEHFKIVEKLEDELLVDLVKRKFENALASNDQLSVQQKEYLENLLNKF
ncbi:MAG: hypothetical protein ACLFQS_01845 [Bacteroidales bacterium]